MSAMRVKKKASRAARRHRWAVGLVACMATMLLVAVLFLMYVSPYAIWSRTYAVLHEAGEQGYIPVSAQPLDIAVDAPQAFVYDMSAGEILWQKGEERVVYPASITKLWSILTALEYLSPEEIITVGDEVSLIDPASSRAYVSAGQRLTVEMLIEGMLLPSGNDAAYALAAAAGRVIDPEAATASDQIAAFVGKMNERAAASGLCGSVFLTPDGLAGEEHYTTVEDMILICRMAMEEPVIARYASLASDDVVYESGEVITWVNTNRLLHSDDVYYREGVIGLKTGSLEHNYCVIAAYECEEKIYLIGIFGAWDKNMRFEDACVVIDALGDD
ncbi:MAG: D-alanyl-D-alanine carboxypeptidase [Clostridia bacterium]|nr:D-alanyl-D-alanine carboxypeptidase [Clostridia bacterium]